MAKCPICSNRISHHYWVARAPELEQAFDCPHCQIPLMVTGLSRFGSLLRFLGIYGAIVLFLAMSTKVNPFNMPFVLTGSLLILLVVHSFVHRQCQTFDPLAYPLTWGDTVCNECNEPFHPSNAVQFGDDVTICPSCMPRYAQKVKEGIALKK